MSKHSWKCNYPAILRYFIFNFFWGEGGQHAPQTPLRPPSDPLNGQKFISSLHPCKSSFIYRSPFFHTCRVDSSGCPKEETTAKNFVWNKSSSYSQQNLENPVGGGIHPLPPDIERRQACISASFMEPNSGL